MTDWLVQYGIKRHKVDYDEIDVNDRLRLEEQINASRKNWHELLSLLDDIQGKYVEINLEISNLVKNVTEESIESGIRLNQLLSINDKYITLEAQQKALSAGMSMVNNQIDFCKNDLRILNSVFYNKF